jgi:hypothetical protein
MGFHIHMQIVRLRLKICIDFSGEQVQRAYKCEDAFKLHMYVIVWLPISSTTSVYK